MFLSKNACYSAKSMLLSQKQRRYTYDSIVYAPTLTLLTILYIVQVLIKAHPSFEHLIFNGFNYSEICLFKNHTFGMCILVDVPT